MSRRQVLAGAGSTGLLAATAGSAKAATVRGRRARAAASDGTPEQIHLTWGDSPASSVVISWASPGRASRPRARIGQRVIPAEVRTYTDGISGETVWSARRDTSTGYGIAVFDVDPGAESGQPSIKVTHYHAVGADPVNPTSGVKGAPTPDYTEFETFRLVRPRSS